MEALTEEERPTENEPFFRLEKRTARHLFRHILHVRNSLPATDKSGSNRKIAPYKILSLYVTLLGYANATERVKAGEDVLMKATGLSRRVLYRCLDILDRAGLIERNSKDSNHEWIRIERSTAFVEKTVQRMKDSDAAASQAGGVAPEYNLTPEERVDVIPERGAGPPREGEDVTAEGAGVTYADASEIAPRVEMGVIPEREEQVKCSSDTRADVIANQMSVSEVAPIGDSYSNEREKGARDKKGEVKNRDLDPADPKKENGNRSRSLEQSQDYSLPDQDREVKEGNGTSEHTPTPAVTRRDSAPDKQTITFPRSVDQSSRRPEIKRFCSLLAKEIQERTWKVKLKHREKDLLARNCGILRVGKLDQFLESENVRHWLAKRLDAVEVSQYSTVLREELVERSGIAV